MSDHLCPDQPCPHVLTVYEPPQRIEPLAIMVGQFVRDFVAPKDRLDAVDRLYSLLHEARAGRAVQDDGLPTVRHFKGDVPMTPECEHPAGSLVPRQQGAAITCHKNLGGCGAWFYVEARSTPAASSALRAVQDEWYEQDSGGGDDSAKGVSVAPAQVVTSLPRPNPSPHASESGQPPEHNHGSSGCDEHCPRFGWDASESGQPADNADENERQAWGDVDAGVADRIGVDDPGWGDASESPQPPEDSDE